MAEEDVFAQLNAMTAQNKDLQRKVDNLSLLMSQREEELVASQAQVADLTAASSAETQEEAKRDMARLLKAKNELSARVATLTDKNQGLQDEVTRLSAQLEEADRTVLQRNLGMAELEKAAERAQAQAARQEREVAEAEERSKVKDAKLAELQEAANSRQEQLDALESESRSLNTQKRKMEMKTKQIEHLRKQILLTAQTANQKHNELQNQLQSTRQLLSELQVEYEEDMGLARLEWEEERRRHEEELNGKTRELATLQLIQFEDTQQMYREQQQVVKALRSQFEEYRETAEFLFQTEIAKLEHKINTQMVKYEQEIRYILKTKDQHYDEMMTYKDAKIMNLIEGTDFQAVLVKHAHEIEVQRKIHTEELAEMRRQVQQECHQQIGDLARQIASQDLALQRLKQQSNEHQAQLDAAHDLVAQRDLALADKDRHVLSQTKMLQEQLDEAHAVSERLNQDKQDLRHQLIRTKLEASGATKGSTLPEVVGRLTLEMEELSRKFCAQIAAHEELSLTATEDRRRLERVSRQNTMLQQELERRASDYEDLAKTYSRFVARRNQQQARTRGPISRGAVSEDMTPTEAQRILATNRRFVGPAGFTMPLPEPEPSAAAAATANPPAGGGAALTADEEAAHLAKELQMGMQYLKRFQRVSNSYRSGDLDSRLLSSKDSKDPKVHTSNMMSELFPAAAEALPDAETATAPLPPLYGGDEAVVLQQDEAGVYEPPPPAQAPLPPALAQQGRGGRGPRGARGGKVGGRGARKNSPRTPVSRLVA